MGNRTSRFDLYCHPLRGGGHPFRRPEGTTRQGPFCHPFFPSGKIKGSRTINSLLYPFKGAFLSVERASWKNEKHGEHKDKMLDSRMI